VGTKSPFHPINMPIQSVADFLEALRASGLLAPANLAEMLRHQARFADARALARQLIDKGWLTPFQVNYLFQGRSQELTLGPYVLLERLGQGGMGQVFKARHQLMERLVAVKLIRKERLADPDALRRFHREIRAASQVAHPNVVIAHDAAQIGDTHFLVMEYVPGTDLARLVKQAGPLPVDRACDYVRQAALGLQHAHQRGLVHRDIKPQNLLLASEGEVVKVLDLGLARLSQASEQTQGDLTQEGTVMGTPDYLAPEQAQESHTVDIRADLYSLGCTLYYLLTGRVPFPGGTLADKIGRLLLKEPIPVEELRPDAPSGVGAIVRKLMAKRPDDRYQTPAAAAAALEPFAGSRPPLAIPLGVAVPHPSNEGSLPANLASSQTHPMAMPWASSPVSAGLAPIAAVAQVLAPAPPSGNTETIALSGADSVPSATSLAAPGGRRRRSRWRKLWRKTLRRWRSLTCGQRWLIAGGGCAVLLIGVLLLILLPGSGKDSGQPRDDQSQPSIIKHEDPRFPDVERYSWQPKELVAVLGEHGLRHRGEVMQVLYSPDGKILASVGNDQVIRLWDAETGRELGFLRDPGSNPGPVAISPDSKTLASANTDLSIKLWDLRSRRLRGSLKVQGAPITSLAFLPESNILVSGISDKRMQFWDVLAERPIESIGDELAPSIKSWAISPNGKLLAWSFANRITVANLSKVKGMLSCKLKNAFSFNGFYEPDRLSFSPDNRSLFAVAHNGGPNSLFLKRWDVLSWKERPFDKPLGGGAPSFAFSADGKVIAGGPAGHYSLYDAESGKELYPLPSSLSYGCLAFAPDGNSLAFREFAGNWTIRLWDVPGNRKLGDFHGHMGAARAVAFMADGKSILSTSFDRTLRAWDVARRKQSFVSEGAKLDFLAVSFSPDRRLLVSGGNDQMVRIWDTASGKEKLELAGHDGPVFAVAFGRQESTVASGGRDGFIRIWDLPKGTARVKLDNRETPVHALAFSPEGKLLASGDFAGVVKLWDTATGKKLTELKTPEGSAAHAAAVRAVVFSPNGLMVASGGMDGVVRLWDVAGRKLKAPPLGQGASVQSLAFGPDGLTLASGGDDGIIRLWFTEPAGEWMTLQGNAGSIHGLAFSSDGRMLATANAQKTVTLWNTVRHQVPTLRGHTGPVVAVAFGPGGKELASCASYPSSDSSAKLWSVATGRLEDSIRPGDGDHFRSVEFTDTGTRIVLCQRSAGKDARQDLYFWDGPKSKPFTNFDFAGPGTLAMASTLDGKRVATIAFYQPNMGKLHVWDPGHGQAPALQKDYSQDIRAVALSPEGNTVAVAGAGGVELWDVAKKRIGLKIQADFVYTIAFSPDGKYLAGGGFRTVSLWNAVTGKGFIVFPQKHESPVVSVAFFPNGKFLVTSGEDGRVVVWSVASERPVWDCVLPWPVRAVAVDDQGKYIATGNENGTVYLLRLAGL
jgi:serine/threonine-protein kinase